jgi:hypothetical protein
MRNTMLPLAAFVLAALPSLYAGTLNGVTLPDTAQVGGATLVLNGMGLRTKYMVKVYVAGLYLPRKSSDANSILKSDEPKRMVMHFVRGISKSQFTDGFMEGFEKNSAEAAQTLKADIDRLFSVLGAVKEGDEVIFSYVSGPGTTVTIGDQEKITIPGQAFAEMLFSVWLGPKPPNESLKNGLLGR